MKSPSTLSEVVLEMRTLGQLGSNRRRVPEQKASLLLLVGPFLFLLH